MTDEEFTEIWDIISNYQKEYVGTDVVVGALSDLKHKLKEVHEKTTD